MHRTATLLVFFLSATATLPISVARGVDRDVEPPRDQVEVDPVASLAHDHLGIVAIQAGEYAEALQEFTKAIKLDPDNAMARNNRAFLRATCPMARYRDAAKAIADATRACELSRWKDSNALDTLAAAYAEKADFDQAQKWQSKAIELTSDESEKIGMRARQELYQAGKPYREGPTASED